MKVSEKQNKALSLTQAKRECKRLTIVNGKHQIDKIEVTVLSIKPNRISSAIYEVLVTSQFNGGYKFDTVDRFIKKATAIE